MFFAGAYGVVVVGSAELDDETVERRAVDELHRHLPVAVFALRHRVDRHDRRVVEPGVEAALLDEGADRPRVVAEFRVERLDRHHPVEERVLGFAHFADAA